MDRRLASRYTVDQLRAFETAILLALFVVVCVLTVIAYLILRRV